jgi:Cu+-exporting ATPase
MTRDPVCGMELEEATAAARSEYEGTTYYFCSDSCKETFDANPGKYAPAALDERTGDFSP